MSSPLSEAVARCHLRRLLGIVAAAPLPALVLAAGVLVAPFGFCAARARTRDELAGSPSAHGVAEAIVAGPMLAAAVAGTALAVSLPERSALGGQIAAAPVRAASVVVAHCLVPAVGAVIVVGAAAHRVRTVRSRAVGRGRRAAAAASPSPRSPPSPAAPSSPRAVSPLRGVRGGRSAVVAIGWLSRGPASGSSSARHRSGRLAPVALGARRERDAPRLRSRAPAGACLALSARLGAPRRATSGAAPRRARSSDPARPTRVQPRCRQPCGPARPAGRCPPRLRRRDPLRRRRGRPRDASRPHRRPRRSCSARRRPCSVRSSRVARPLRRPRRRPLALARGAARGRAVVGRGGVRSSAGRAHDAPVAAVGAVALDRLGRLLERGRHRGRARPRGLGPRAARRSPRAVAG